MRSEQYNTLYNVGIVTLSFLGDSSIVKWIGRSFLKTIAFLFINHVEVPTCSPVLWDRQPGSKSTRVVTTQTSTWTRRARKRSARTWPQTCRSRRSLTRCHSWRISDIGEDRPWWRISAHRTRHWTAARAWLAGNVRPTV